MSPLKFIHGVNTSDEQVRANVEWALAHVDADELMDRRCLILGGGPSANNVECGDALFNGDWGDTLFALNNSWRLLKRVSLPAPTFVVMMDARPENADFVDPRLGTTWLLASQCHKSVFSKLESADVLLWHVAGSAVVNEKGLKAIPGGGTVLSSAINIATSIGFTRITLAGVDSSLDGDRHHAYAQPLNDDDRVINVETPAGTKFRTTPELAAQADGCMNQMLTLERAGITFEIIGDGLLPTLWREHNELRADPDKWEPEKYRRVWAHSEYGRHSPAIRMIEEIVSHIQFDKHVIDFGCGGGTATAELIERGWSATGVDFASNALSESIPFVEANLWSLPADLRGDVGICIDVMEHIPPEKVDAVLSCIAKAVPKCVFSICYLPDAMGVLIGETLHLSVHPESWWLNKLSEHFKTVTTDNGLIICEEH